jgi:hypothetical protein
MNTRAMVAKITIFVSLLFGLRALLADQQQQECQLGDQAEDGSCSPLPNSSWVDEIVDKSLINYAISPRKSLWTKNKSKLQIPTFSITLPKIFTANIQTTKTTKPVFLLS